jgi:hypothetical protein
LENKWKKSSSAVPKNEKDDAASEFSEVDSVEADIAGE